MKTKPKLDMDTIAKVLGAERRGEVRAASGHFGAMQIVAEIPKLPEVLVVPENTTPEQLANYIFTGELPEKSVGMTLEEFERIGRVEDCDCGLIQCVCQEARKHKKDCPLRFSMTCAIPFPCDEHGMDVCPICTPCNCHPIQPASKKLHLGAGDVSLEGWHNTDLSPEKPYIHKLDVREKFPFEDESLDLIFSEHMIEHLTHADGQFMLGECYRVLKTGGAIRIATPDLGRLIDLFHTCSRDHTAYLEWIAGLNHPESTRPCIVINNAFYNWGHKFLYDFETLQSIILNAGFKSVKRFAVGRSDREELRGIEAHGRVVGSERMNEFETMVVEAYK